MDGITVLNETVKASKSCILIIGILGFLALLVGIFLFLKKIAFLGAIAIFIAICFIVFFAFVYPKRSETIQEIAVDESVKLLDFNEYYDLIEQKGDNFIVRVKDAEDTESKENIANEKEE